MKSKILKCLLNAIFVASFLILTTACDMENEDKVYPENITAADKNSINTDLSNSDTADYSDLLTMLDNISSFLNKYKNDENAAEYKSIIDGIRSETKKVSINSLNSIIQKETYKTPEDYVKIENDDYTNYDEYISVYNSYKEACEKYKAYYNGEYTENYNDYKTLYDQLSENPENYNSLLNFIRLVISDFKDNYSINDNTFTADKTRQLLSDVVSEQNSLALLIESLDTSKISLYSKLTKVEEAADILEAFVLTKDNDFELPENPENPEPPYTTDHPINYTTEDINLFNWRYAGGPFDNTKDYPSLLLEMEVISSVLSRYPNDATATKYKTMLDSIYSSLSRINTMDYHYYEMEEKNYYINEYDNLKNKIDNTNNIYSNYDEYQQLYETYLNTRAEVVSIQEDYDNYYSLKEEALNTIKGKCSLIHEYALAIVNDFVDDYAFSELYSDTTAESYVSALESADEVFNQAFDVDNASNKLWAYSDACYELDCFNLILAPRSNTIYLNEIQNLKRSDVDNDYEMIYIAVPDGTVEVNVFDMYFAKKTLDDFLMQIDDEIYETTGDFWYKPDTVFAPYPESVTKLNFVFPECENNYEYIDNTFRSYFRFPSYFMERYIPLCNGVSLRWFHDPDNNYWEVNKCYTGTGGMYIAGFEVEKTGNVQSIDIDLSKVKEFEIMRYKDSVTGITIPDTITANYVNLDKTKLTGEILKSEESEDYADIFMKFITHNYSKNNKIENLPYLNNVSFQMLEMNPENGEFINEPIKKNGLNLLFEIIKYYISLGVYHRITYSSYILIDGAEFTNGEPMYNEDFSFNKAYEMDINLFLVIATETNAILKNIVVTGTNTTDIKVFPHSNLKNIRFESDLSDLEWIWDTEEYHYGLDYEDNKGQLYKEMIGIIDFAGKVPQTNVERVLDWAYDLDCTSFVSDFIILRKGCINEGSIFKIYPNYYIDISELSVEEALNVFARNIGNKYAATVFLSSQEQVQAALNWKHISFEEGSSYFVGDEYYGVMFDPAPTRKPTFSEAMSVIDEHNSYYTGWWKWY